MAQDTRITGVYEIKIEQGPALRAFEEVKKKLDNTKAAIRELNKENKALIQQENELTAAIKRDGVATAEQARQLEFVRKKRDELNKKLSEAVITEKGLSAQSRELTNDLAKLTENGLRFRDKMAQATVEALKQTGVLEQLTAKENQLSATLQGVNRALDQSQQELTQLNAAYAKGDKDAEAYKQEQAALNKEIEAGKAAQSLLKTELDQVSGKTNVLEQRVHELNVELNAGKISQQQYRDGLQRIEAETAKAGAATGQLTAKFDSFVGGQGAQLKSALGSLALSYVGIGAAVYGVQKLVGGAIDTMVAFNKELSGIKALGGEYAANIDDIGDAAKTAGINFGFTATESLKAVEALAKAGVSTTDILGGGLKGALTLAAAGEISVGEAAETASKAMTQFGLAGEDIPHLADLLAAAAATATGDVGDFNQALSQAGLVASQLNIPIEEAIGTLTAFASAGLLGSDAGTSFRTMLLRLQNPTEKSAELLEKYNIDAFDLQGNFVGIESLAGQLQDRLGGLTQEQRSAALAQVFGSDAIRAANVLYTQGAEGVASYTEQVNQSGFAQRVAQEQTNNLTGDLAKLASQYDALVLSVEDGDGAISNAFRGFTQGITEALGLVQEYNKLSGDRASFTKDADNFLSKINKGRDGLSKLTFDSAAGEEFVERYRQVITSIKDTEDSEQRLSKAIDNRAQALARVNSLQEKIAASPADDSRYQLELAAAKAAVVQSQEIINATRQATEAKQVSTEVTKQSTDATVKDTKAQGSSATAAQNAAGSVADLNDKIGKLRDQQSQSTSSDQFATYEAQIKSLSDEVDVLTGKLSREFLDAANAIPERIAPRLPEPQITSGEDVLNTELLGLNPNAPELVGKTLSEVQDVINEAELNRLSNSMDFNDQLLAVELQWKDGSIQTLQEYEEQRAEIFDRIKEQERAAADARVDITRNSFEVLQEMSDLAFDKKIAQLDAQSSGLNDKLKKATTDEEKARIEGQIKATEAQKTQLEAQKKSQQVFAVAAALIATYQSAQAAYLSQLTIPSPDAPIRAAAAAAIATAAGLINVAKIRGLATGGEVEPSGTVSSTWGTAVNRPNGDNVLVRTQKGFVTLKTGEKVLNDEQQERLERITGRGVWGAIGMPGHAKAPTGSVAYSGFARHYLHQGFAEGGTVGIITPRPTSATIVNNQLASVIGASLDRPIYTDIQEVRSFNSRVEITESARSIG